MCILCVIQKWSRRVITMLPWLVLPLIGLWALSQLLPPPFRFETTYPRLACVFVLLVSLCWHWFLFPQLTAWRDRRIARHRERKRFELIELQKLRKTATRKCRNCQTPYKDQNPGGGKFMCSYCGHNSKRPVLDLPVAGVPNSGIFKDLVGKGGKILNGKGWSENGWMCGQDWLENANWVSGSVAGKPSYCGKNGTGVFGGDEDCLAEKSYSGVVILACKLLMTLFLSIRWFFRKIFRISSSADDALYDSDHTGVKKRGENSTSFNESRVEKARRKAEERRQARLEKKLLEEEERKQREDVARLVEERRRLRDEKLEAEKDHTKLSAPAREKEMKKEAEKKRQERKKEKGKASSKNNSDAEEVEKRVGKETDRKCDIVKKSEIDWRDDQNSGTDNAKGHTLETGLGMKSTSNKFSRGNAGTRYFDRMRGTIFSSSKALTGSSFFGKSSNNPITVIKENKTNKFVDHVNTSAHRKDFCSSESVSGKLSLNGDDKNVKTNNPVLSDPQLRAATKKSWQQLFTTSSSSVPPISNPNVITRPNSKIQAEPQSLPLPSHSTIQTFDNPISFGLPSPFISTNPNGVPGSSLGFTPSIEPIFPYAADRLHEFTPEEPELFEDPCYVPDIMSSLLGPISESLENFQSNLDAGFGTDTGIEKPRALKNLSASSEINKPSPIESPLSRLRSSEERYNISNRFLSNPNAQDLHNFHVNATNASEEKEWQMWNSSPLGQDGPGSVGGPASWLLPREHNRSSKEEFVLPTTQKTMTSFFTKEDHIPAGTQCPQNAFLGSSQNGGPSSPVIGRSDHDPWLQNAVFPPLAGSDNHFPIKREEEMSKTSCGSPSESASSHPFEPSPVNCWPKKESAMHSSGEAVLKPSVGWPHVGGLFSTPDVQPPW